MMSVNWLMQTCPWCEKQRDDGTLIQTDFHDETVYVCLECAEEYFDGDQSKYLGRKIRRCREQVLSHFRKDDEVVEIK